MKPWQVIAAREFKQMVQARSYLVVTVLGALLVAGLAFLPLLLPLLQPREEAPLTLLVTAPSDLFTEVEASARALPGRPGVEPRWLGREASPELLQRAADLLEGSAASGWLVLTRAEPGRGGEPLTALYLSRDPAQAEARVRALLGPLVTSARAEQAGIGPAQAAWLLSPIPLTTRALAAGEPSPSPLQEALAQALSYVLLIGLYMATVFYGQAISNGVIQDKGSRVVELLAGAASPAQILLGKVAGIGGAGLLQFGAWILVGLVFSLPAAASRVAAALGLGPVHLSVGRLPPFVLLYFALFFLLGYTLYAFLYAAFASTASRLEEAQQALLIPIFLVVGGFLVAVSAWTAPHGRLAVAGSLFPFFAPLTLFTRIVLTEVPPWQLAAGLTATLAAIGLTLAFAAAAYRRNLLRYRRIPLRELFFPRPGRRRGAGR